MSYAYNGIKACCLLKKTVEDGCEKMAQSNRCNSGALYQYYRGLRFAVLWLAACDSNSKFCADM